MILGRAGVRSVGRLAIIPDYYHEIFLNFGGVVVLV